ncbi:MAG: RluA family pseudouridine synthase [Chloroflexi bacterium]|nr:RluA family pseudouridine synthase [Chloroflexota bacterium]MYC48611.1 RluA family pseudouridine synthase [Chloroflexota bacterium]
MNPAQGPALRFTASEADNGERLDRALTARLPDQSRSAIQKQLHAGAGTINGQIARPARRISAGDEIEFMGAPTEMIDIVAQDVAFEVLDRDQGVLALVKPAGLSVHPGPGHPDRTLVNGLLHRYPQIAAVGGSVRPGIVHRLDLQTSGVMLAALTEEAFLHLQAEFAARRVAKTYLAICRGVPEHRQALIEAPIGRSVENRRAQSVRSARGRPATTAYRVLAAAERTALLEIDLITGRTHQARVHLAALGHPLLGDSLYGDGSGARRHMLHSRAVEVALPDGEMRRWRSEPPPDFIATLERIGLDWESTDCNNPAQSR